jgi:MoaA/NifB/PqqE/SkfB family radical SAM enzyme
MMPVATAGHLVSSLITNALCRANEITNRTLILPLLIFYPTSRCNSRCISCDWWQSTGEDDLTLAEIEELAACLPALGTRLVLLSGGEPLLCREIFEIAAMFQAQGTKLWLLTSGLLLNRYARQVAEHFSRVTISLDASNPTLYHAVRGVDALTTVEMGVRRLKAVAPNLPVTARATLHRANYRELPQLVDKARALNLDGISFLAADVSSTAFGRTAPLAEDSHLLLSREEVTGFRSIIEETVASHSGDFESGYIAEQPAKLRRLPQYYAAMNGDEAFPPVSCNAPWVSVVVEANGTVRPCFFHQPVGNIRHKSLVKIVHEDLRDFRQQLDVLTNPTCQRCVCSLKVGLRSNMW